MTITNADTWTALAAKLAQLEAERDAALARVAELDAACDEFDSRYDKGVQQYRERALAAESALASARTYAQNAFTYLNDADDLESTPLHAIGHARTELRALLSSHPAPAPVAAESEPEQRTMSKMIAECRDNRARIATLQTRHTALRAAIDAAVESLQSEDPIRRSHFSEHALAFLRAAQKAGG